MAKKDISVIAWERIEKAIRDRGGTEKDLERLVKDKALVDRVADAILWSRSPTPVLSLTVNYGQTLKEMLRRGKYDWVHPDITKEHFPIEGKGKKRVTLELVHFARPMTSKEVEKEFLARGITPGKIEHLLSLGLTPRTRDLQRQFPIIAPGSFWYFPPSHRLAPVLWGDASGRRLSLGWAEDGWDAGFRFLGSRP